MPGTREVPEGSMRRTFASRRSAMLLTRSVTPTENDVPMKRTSGRGTTSAGVSSPGDAGPIPHALATHRGSAELASIEAGPLRGDTPLLVWAVPFRSLECFVHETLQPVDALCPSNPMRSAMSSDPGLPTR